MREKPDIPEDRIADCLRTHYGMESRSIRFLPIGYDLRAFVYEVITTEGNAWFVKIRDGAIHPPALLVPRVLIEAGVPHILAPIRTRMQELWCSLDTYSVVVYPFIRGENAKVAGMSDSQWVEFGATLQAIHSGGFAAQLQEQVPAETFSLPSGELVRRILAILPNAQFESPAAARLAAFWTENAPFIQHIVARAEELGRQLQTRPFEYVLCHADMHTANILVSDEGGIYLIDWDGPLLAPRERDMLFFASSQSFHFVKPREEALFFQGYGTVEIDLTALAYYRYERAIEDIGVNAEGVFWNAEMSEEMRAAETEFCMLHFQPGHMIPAALEADRNQEQATV